MALSTEMKARDTSGMYLVRVFRRSRSSASARCLRSLTLSCMQHRSMARLTARWTSGMSSPMYSFPVPLNGTFVLTRLTKTPILSWFCRILYAPQLMRRLLTCVATSPPPSKRSGMRLAKRWTVIPGLASRPPRQTPTSTSAGWPSTTHAVSWKVATQSGLSSFMMPKRKLYSPTGLRQSAGGSANLASRRICVSCTTCARSRDAVAASGVSLSSASSRVATAALTPVSSLARNLARSFSLDPRSSVESSSMWSEAGWCLIVAGGRGISSERRAYSRVRVLLAVSEVTLRPKRAYGVMMASWRR
mmetsp:Transcript_45646/g.97242  ORF Transcript_45646/g.97242 Transcript_45646/m.97242 type:complete len:304 (-) Transcript_45646:795-1706(-)